jgi:hypothetical protein
MRSMLISVAALIGLGSVATGADQAAGSAKATIHVAVPAIAEIWFSGSKTTSTGTDRRFVSPLLRPGV